MKLSPDNLLVLSEVAIKAAKNAGQLITEYSKKNVEVNHKDVGNNLESQVVTEVDLKSQEIVMEHVVPTLAKYDLALLSEESPDDGSRFKKDYFWCIDPLDGTLQFTRSVPGYAIAISLISTEGIPHIGVVYDPVTDTLYHAVKGCGVFRNGECWNPQLSNKSLTVVTDSTFMKHEKFGELMAGLEILSSDLGYSDFIKIKGGGGVMSALWALENSPAIYMKLPKLEEGGGCLWDFGATACIYNELSYSVSDVYGEPLDLNRKESLFMNHKGVLFAHDAEIVSSVINILEEIE